MSRLSSFIKKLKAGKAKIEPTKLPALGVELAGLDAWLPAHTPAKPPENLEELFAQYEAENFWGIDRGGTNHNTGIGTIITYSGPKPVFIGKS